MKIVKKFALLSLILCVSFSSQAVLAGNRFISGIVTYILQTPDSQTAVVIRRADGTLQFLSRSGPLNSSTVALSDAASSRQTVAVGYTDSTFEFDFVSRSY